VALAADFRELTVAPVVPAAQQRRQRQGRPRGGRRRYGLGPLLHARPTPRTSVRMAVSSMTATMLAHPGVGGADVRPRRHRHVPRGPPRDGRGEAEGRVVKGGQRPIAGHGPL